MASRNCAELKNCTELNNYTEVGGQLSRRPDAGLKREANGVVIRKPASGPPTSV
jgi:hypothetical protein